MLALAEYLNDMHKHWYVEFAFLCCFTLVSNKRILSPPVLHRQVQSRSQDVTIVTTGLKEVFELICCSSCISHPSWFISRTVKTLAFLILHKRA